MKTPLTTTARMIQKIPTEIPNGKKTATRVQTMSETALTSQWSATMSKLELYNRPVVLFDPSNKLHRQHFSTFMATGSWSSCPVRFAVEEDHGNLMAHLQRKTIMWYAAQEGLGRVKTTTKPGRRQSLGVTASGFELTV